MCVGVDVGLAGEKFSTSPNMFGFKEIVNIISSITSIKGVVSFTIK